MSEFRALYYTFAQNELDYDERDVLVLQEDQEETDLQQCEKTFIEGQGSSASTTERDKGQLFDEIDLELSEKEVLGPRVSDGLATIVNGRFSRKLSEKVQKEKFEAHNRPENCEKLVVPLVNKVVWAKLSLEQRKSDLKVAHAQHAIIKATTTIASVADQNEASRQNAGLIRHCKDAIALLGHATHELSMFRCRAICPPVNPRLCDEGIEITDNLGDNLASALNDITEFDKIGHKAMSVGGGGGGGGGGVGGWEERKQPQV